MSRQIANGKQLRAFLARHEWTQTQAAKWLDISARNVRRYIADELPLPRVVEMALLYLEMI